jgi:L-lysine 2,3-aminomutase
MRQQKDEHVIQQKMEEVQAILEYLAAEHDMHYVLLSAEEPRNSSKIEINEIMHNAEISNEALVFFHEQLVDLDRRINIIPDLIKTGEIIVVCTDDSNRPANIKDWVKKDAVYCVDLIHRTHTKGEMFYKLRGLDTAPFDGFNSKRFKIVEVKEHLN